MRDTASVLGGSGGVHDEQPRPQVVTVSGMMALAN
jgi:hypothetical protein